MTAHAGAGPPGAHQTDSEPPGGVDPDTGQERAAVIQPIAELFHPNCVAFWAATFTIDLSLFNEYLLGRLGDAPLNAVVLADRDRLDATLTAIPADRLDLLGPVNRRWLLRGAKIGAGRFHPKAYLAVTPRSAQLLVGSGNLSSEGIDAGREVFTSFVTGTAGGDAAVATWRHWMRRLVAATHDTLLVERFTDLEQRLHAAMAPSTRTTGTTTSTRAADSPLWHNLDRTLADQLAETILAHDGHVDELIVTAPFYDEGGEALGTLADRLRPGRLTVYVTSTTSVDGRRLAARLAGTGAEVRTLAYQPDRFTHAKLIGVTAGQRGWLLSGSANLSQAALTLPARLGNVELAVLTRLTPAGVRRSFLPPDVRAEPRTLDALDSLAFQVTSEAPPRLPVRLTQARQLADGRVHVSSDPAAKPGWRLADHISSQPIVPDQLHQPGNDGATTTGPLLGRLVQLLDANGATLSNHLVVDDVTALRHALQVSEQTGSSRPAELAGADLDTPLGQAMLHLHRHVVMDVSERADGTGSAGEGAAGSTDVLRDELTDDDDDDLWVRLERDKLGRDPRAGTYARLVGGSGADGGVAEPLMELLAAMRDRSPAPPPPATGPARSLLRMLTDDLDTDPGLEHADRADGARWSLNARVRVRARNVLRRWAAAQTDPRLTWVDPLAPLGNLLLIAACFARLWRDQASPGALVELTHEDLTELWQRWFWPFLGSGSGSGWLAQLDNDGRIHGMLHGELAHTATALCWLAVRPGEQRRERLVAWQPYLQAALELDLLIVDDDTAAYLSACGYPIKRTKVEQDLLDAMTFLDDALWCSQRANELELLELRLEPAPPGTQGRVLLRVCGISDPLGDPRVPVLLAGVAAYRSANNIALRSDDLDWRLAVEPGESLFFLPRPGGEGQESPPLVKGAIAGLARSQGVLADLFPRDIDDVEVAVGLGLNQ